MNGRSGVVTLDIPSTPPPAEQVANAGDSRCVMCRGGRAIAMTVDHKPNDEAEHDRILKVGGRRVCSV